MSFIFFCCVVNLAMPKTKVIWISIMGIPLPRSLLRFLYHPRQVSDIPSWLRIANRYPTIELQKNQILSIRWQTLRTLHFQANTHFSMLQLFAKIQNRLQLGLINKFSHKEYRFMYSPWFIQYTYVGINKTCHNHWRKKSHGITDCANNPSHCSCIVGR